MIPVPDGPGGSLAALQRREILQREFHQRLLTKTFSLSLHVFPLRCLHLVTCSWLLCCRLAFEKDAARVKTSDHQLFFAFIPLVIWVGKQLATANSIFLKTVFIHFQWKIFNRVKYYKNFNYFNKTGLLHRAWLVV